jgi:hypothetical protein
MHSADHDPTVDHAECFTCNGILARAFNEMADLDLGPNGVDTLMQSIRRLVAEAMAQGPAA